jgi:hypothetical protein
MRNLEYLSPSGIQAYLQDKENYWMSYLSDVRAPRFLQTQPMSIGSSFDAIIKSFLHEKLFGKVDGSRFDLDTIFKSQVEEQHREWALPNGHYVMDCYRRSGALCDLLLELESAVDTPRFEIEIKGVVNGVREGVTKNIGGVTFLGRPDVTYTNKKGTRVVFDFKINGYCGSHNTSPKPGYMRLRSGSGQYIATAQHKNCLAMEWKGTVINTAQYLEDIDEGWARQLAIYSWLLGIEVGEECIMAIDQIVAKPGKPFPELRIAEHRTRVSSKFQWDTFALAEEIWEATHSDHFFRDLPKAESIAKCEMLDKQALALARPATEEDRLFNAMTRAG